MQLSLEQSAVEQLPQQQRQRCEVWTRVMGYHRPVSAFNPGKQSEHHERLHFSEAPRSATGRCFSHSGSAAWCR